MSERVALMKSFPLLIPSNDFKSFEGIIESTGSDIQISVKVPYYPLLSDISVKCSPRFGYLLQNHKQLLEEWSQKCTLLTFLENLKHLLVSLVEDHGVIKVEYISAESFKRISEELDEIGVQHIVSLSSNLGRVKLKLTDHVLRDHTVDIDCSNNYPHQPAQVYADLPEYSIRIIREKAGLREIFHSFVKEVTNLQQLWNILDTLDSSCWVMDPENPTRKDTGRRIIIDKTVSIYLNFDPENVSLIPSITFLGPEQAVAPYQQHLTAHKELWNPLSDVLINLKTVLGLETLIRKPKEEEEEDCLVREGECCICYTTHLNGELPSEICEDSRCASLFHASCLFQWLQTVTGNYQSFNRIHGACPNCGTVISCPVPD